MQVFIKFRIQNFQTFHNIVMERQLFQIGEEKQKLFTITKIPKIQFIIETV